MPSKRRRVTLKDIAQNTGFAVNTVSRALHDAEDLAVATKATIQAAAREMGYIANASADSLRSGATHSLALIVADIINPLFAIIAKQIEIEARKCGYSIFIVNTDENEENEISAVRTAIGKAVDGVMLFQTEKTRESVRLLENNGVPYVLLQRAYDDQSEDIVAVNEEQGGYLAGCYLLERGCRHNLMIDAPDYISSSRLRKRGFLRAMQEAGTASDYSVVHLADLHDDCGYILKEQFKKDECPDGIFCFSDIIAYRAVNLLTKSGIEVGRDVTIIGFDDIASAMALPFELPSIGYDKEGTAREVVRLMLRRVRGDYADYPHRIVFEPRIVVY